VFGHQIQDRNPLLTNASVASIQSRPPDGESNCRHPAPPDPRAWRAKIQQRNQSDRFLTAAWPIRTCPISESLPSQGHREYIVHPTPMKLVCMRLAFVSGDVRFGWLLFSRQGVAQVLGKELNRWPMTPRQSPTPILF